MWDPVILDVECIVCNKSLQKINHNIHKPPVSAQNMGKVANNRRSRTPNWSADEKQYLLKLIKDRKEVIVTKNNNGPNYSEEKDVAWHEILRELSVRFGDKFSAHSIKKVKTQWQNMKRIAREEISLNEQNLQKCTKQTLEVCDILELVKDGVLDKDNENQNDNLSSNIEIKTETLDEDMSQPSCSGVDVSIVESQDPQSTGNRDQSDSPPTSDSEQQSETNQYENRNLNRSDRLANNLLGPKFHSTFLEDITNYPPYNRQLNGYIQTYSSAEKKLKIETLKEERQVMRAMRETAELNKIIAEQKLKHVLWLKKQDMEMYANGIPGSGAGSGGGGGGTIRQAGGSLGKAGAAKEEQYFYNKQKEQLEQLSHMKTHLDKEINFHEQQIKYHEDAIRRQIELKNKIKDDQD